MKHRTDYVYSGDIDENNSIVIHRHTVCDYSYDGNVITIKSDYGDPVNGRDNQSNMLRQCEDLGVYVSCVHPAQSPFFESKHDAITHWNLEMAEREKKESEYYRKAFAGFCRWDSKNFNPFMVVKIWNTPEEDEAWKDL